MTSPFAHPAIADLPAGATGTACAKVGVLIRFKNSASTLPGVLSALRAQTVQPDFILGVDTGSTDGSVDPLREAGARIVKWDQPYHHAKALNFGVEHCPAELVLVLSSHTVLEDPDTVKRMIATMSDTRTACVSGKWAEADVWTDAISWKELQSTGLRLCSIYSNSFGMFRRSLWADCPFDESLITMEDYGWALEQVKRGYVCRRLNFRFSYQRAAISREYAFAAVTFHLARRHRLRVGWQGVRSSGWALVREACRGKVHAVRMHWGRLLGSLVGRFRLPQAER